VNSPPVKQKRLGCNSQALKLKPGQKPDVHIVSGLTPDVNRRPRNDHG
jgi:hypothetical protein